MALSGSKTVNATSHDQLIFSWSATQSATANTSTVSWNLKLKSDAYGYISSSASKSWSVTVNGTKYSGNNTVGIAKNSTKTLASGTTIISHNSDGTKAFNYSFSQYFGITFSGSTVGTVNGSGSGTLDTIAAKSSLSVSNGTIGVAQTLTVTRQNSNFTHTIAWKAGDQNGTVCTKSSSTSISFTPPNSIAYANTYGTSVNTTFYIETFSGSTSLGTNSYIATMAIPESIVPTISFTISDATTAYSTYGTYVQGVSQLKVSITGTGVYGSSINGYYHTIDGVDYTGSTVTSSTIKNSGTITVIATVYDTRGRRASLTKTVTVAEYSSPKISLLAVHRSNANGDEDMQGSYANVTFSYSITSLNDKNTKNVTLSYKKSTDAGYSTVALTAAYSATNASYVFPADDGSAYDIKLNVNDAFSRVSQTTKISPAYCLYHIPASGKGITFGSIATGDGFNVNMDAHFGNGLTQDVKTLSNTSCKDINKTGTYFLDTTCAETPVNSPGWLVVKSYGSTDYMLQEFYVAASNKKYIRILNGTSWNSWALVTARDIVTRIREDGIWSCRMWDSDYAECWCNKEYTDEAVTTDVGSGLYISPSYIGGDNFPFEFYDVPVVTYANHTTNSTGAMLWAGTPPTKTKCASVRLVRTNNQLKANGFVSFHAMGMMA